MKRSGYFALLAMVVFAGGCGVDGIHSANPRTHIAYGPFELYNSKDVDTTIEYAEWNAATHAFVIRNLKFSDNASNVRKSNAEQMMGMAAQATAHYQGMAQVTTAAFTGMAQLAHEVAPMIGPLAAARMAGQMRGMTATLPGGIGFGSGIPPEFAQAIAELETKAGLAAPAPIAIPSATRPATQPP